MTDDQTSTDTEAADEVAMTPRAIQTRAEMAHEWAASRAAEGILPWSVRQHFGEDMPKLIETVIRLKQDLDEQLNLGAELLARITAVQAIAADLRDPDHTSPVVNRTYLADRLNRALRAEPA